MSLRPITRSRHSRKTRGAYRSFRSRQQWKPWQGWNYHVSKNPLEWFGHKRFVLGIISLIIILGGIVLSEGPLFHSYVSGSSTNDANDPYTYIWEDTLASSTISGWNTMNSIFRDNGGSQFSIRQTGNGTFPAIAVSKTAVDISVVSGKHLSMNEAFFLGGTAFFSQKMYLTRNSTLPNLASYDPYTDNSVALIVQAIQTSASTLAWKVFVQSDPTKSISMNDPGNCEPGSDCFGAGNANFYNTSDGFGVIGNLFDIALNFTGTTASGGNNGLSAAVIGRNTDGTIGNTFKQISFQLPKLQFQGISYYFGLWQSKDSAQVVDWESSTYSSTCFLATNIVSVNIDCMSLAQAVPITVVVQPNIDTGGFFGPIVRALINIGIFILNGILAFIAFIAPAIQSAISFLEGLIKTVLNTIGNALGFGDVGTQLFTFLSQIVSFFTTYLPTGLTNFPTFMARFFDYLNVIFPILPSTFATALTVLTFGVNGVSEGLTIFIFGIQFVTAAYAFFLIFSFIVFTADDALGGVIEYLGTAEALAFFLIKWAALLTNLGLDIGTWLIGLIPKPLIQMAAARLPRIPILESSARIILPSFDFGEFRSGNLLAPWLWTLGFWFDTWYESRNPALPGSLCNLVPATCTNMQLLGNLLPLMQVFVFMSSGVLALWLVMRPLELLGADLGIFESIGVGLGRKPVGGPGGISIAKAGKHFQGRLEKAVAKQKGVQGFKAVGPLSAGAKLEKGIGTREAVSTGSLFE